MGGTVTLSEAYTGTTMHCVFILYNPDVMKINYAPTESSTNTFHGNLTQARAEPSSDSAAVGRDAWRCTLPAAKNAITTNGRQKKKKNARATVRSTVALQFVSINTYALIWASYGFVCAYNMGHAETCSVIKRIYSFLYETHFFHYIHQEFWEILVYRSSIPPCSSSK